MYSVAVTAGFMLEVADYLEKYKDPLLAQKLDVADDILTLRANAKELTKQNGIQEGFKTQLTDQTVVVENLNDTGYNGASSLLDSAIGKLGKRTTQAKEGGQLRSKLHGKAKAKKTPATP